MHCTYNSPLKRPHAELTPMDRLRIRFGRLYEKDLRSLRTLKVLARPARFERATFGFEDRYSIHLSYGRRVRRTTQKPSVTTNLAYTLRPKVISRIPCQSRVFKPQCVGFVLRDSSIVAGECCATEPTVELRNSGDLSVQSRCVLAWAESSLIMSVSY